MNQKTSPTGALRPLLALATAALACPLASAQSSITLYGSIDAYVGVQSATGASSRKVLNSAMNPNALGFAGSEALGDGLVAGFVLEGQPVLDDGSMGQGGKFFGRQAQVYLQGGFGRVTLGRVHLPGRGFGIKYSATGWLTTDPLGNLAIASGSSLAPVMNIDSVGSRVSNAVMYSTPRLGGFSATLVQSTAEGGALSAGNAKLTQVGATYSAGPFTTDLVVSHIPARSGGQIAQTDYAVGAQYTLSGVKLMASYFVRDGWSAATAGSTAALANTKGNDRILIVGASMPMGPHTVGVSVGKLSVADAHRGRLAANMSAPFAAAVDDTTGWSLAYTYALSKRTQWFAAYGTLDNAAQGRASINPGLRPTAGGDSALWASGMRHSF